MLLTKSSISCLYTTPRYEASSAVKVQNELVDTPVVFIMGSGKAVLDIVDWRRWIERGVVRIDEKRCADVVWLEWVVYGGWGLIRTELGRRCMALLLVGVLDYCTL
jgi:hypothetical protein